MRLHPHLPFIWSRRAMWKPALGQNALAQIGEFGLVIEPGEYAESRDTGATVPIRAQTVRVGPVLYHDPGEALTASEAKNALGLDPLRPAALIQLGAGNINDISSALSIVVRRLLQDENLQVCVASSIIGIRETPAFARVKQISVYPLAKYLRAFDFAITAAGYNSYHETIAAGVPAIFVPNLDTALDNQAARASYAEETGVGLALEQVDETSVDRVAQAILDPARRAAMAQRARDRAPINGAADAMAAIERFVAEWETAGTGLRPDAERPLGSGARRIDPGGAQDMSFGRAKPKSASRVFVRRVWMRATRSIRTTLKRRLRIARMVLAGIDSTAARAVRIPVSPGPDEDIVDAAWQAVVMIQIWHPTEEALAEIVANVARLRRSRRSFRPLFVTDADQFGAFRRAGFLFEYLMPPRAWARLDHPLSWSEYRWRRVALLMRTYRPEHVISGSTWEQLEPSLLGAVLDPIAD